MSTTAQDVITSALKKLGVLFKNETPSDDESSDALTSLNNMIASWSNESLIIYADVKETFSLTSGVNSYTIGTGQTFNTDRPIAIKTATINLNNVDYQVDILPWDDYLAQISFKITGSTIPEIIAYDNAFPTGTIYVYPQPATSSATLTLLSEKQLTAFASLTTDVSLPPGFLRALTYNLAIEIASEFGAQPDPTVVAIASSSKGNIKRAALRAQPMTFEMDKRRRYNIYADR